jgi:antitoxin component YwqK of YwqJK toxin-antitoxin module
VIHIVTSKNKPDYHIELTEAWVTEGGAEGSVAPKPAKVSTHRETYPDGKVKATWSGGFNSDDRYVLDGVQTFYNENGSKQWEATFSAGRRSGSEILWDRSGRKMWEKIYAADGTWTWRCGHAESTWRGKDLIDAKF